MDLTYGEPLSQARLVVILAHGRGATAQDILELARALAVPGAAFLLPQAEGNAWYPQPFMAALEANEPWLSRSLQKLAGLVAQAAQAGLGPERVVLGGFSQGACLTSEFAARHADGLERPWGGVLAFSGGLIGPPGTPRRYSGRLEGTRVLVGCSDPDPYIPRARVEETAQVFTTLGADVTLKVYPNLGHTINEEEITLAREILQALLTTPHTAHTP